MADVNNENQLDQNTSKKRSKKSCDQNKVAKKQYRNLGTRRFDVPKDKSNNVIYVTNKTNFQCQLKRCEKLFDAGLSEIIIHGLGAAIYRACNLALHLQKIHYQNLELDIKTSTIDLTEDYEPQFYNDEDKDGDVIERCNSAIHIRVFQKVSLGPFKFPD